MSGWDLGNNGDSSDKKKVEFAKFPVGITRIRILDEEPLTRWTHWLPKFQRSLNCPGRGCPICEIRKNQKANKEQYSWAMAKRVAINIYNYETKRVEVMEQGVTFFEDLRDVMKDLTEDGKNLRDVILKVRRRGEGKDDTSYRIDVDKHEPLTAEEITSMGESLTDLTDFFKPNTNEQILRIVNGEDWNDVMIPEAKEEAAPENTATTPSDSDEEFEVQ